MAIRLKYPAAGMIAAFASGQGAGRRRNRKYMPGGRPGTGRARLPAGGQAKLGGRWIDPLVGIDPSVQGNAARRRAERKARLGKGYDKGLLPYWKSQEEIDREQDLVDWERDDEAKRKAARVGREHDEAMHEDTQAEARDKAAVGRLTEWAETTVRDVRQELTDEMYPEEVRKELRDLLNKITKVVGTGRIGKPAVRAEKLDPLLKRLAEIRKQKKAPLTRDDDLRKGIGDKAFEKYGDAPWQKDKTTGKWELPSGFKLETPEAKAAEKKQTDMDEAKKMWAEAQKAPAEKRGVGKKWKSVGDAYKYVVKTRRELERAAEGGSPQYQGVPHPPAGGWDEPRGDLQDIDEFAGDLQDDGPPGGGLQFPPHPAPGGVGQPGPGRQPPASFEGGRTDPAATAAERRAAELPGGESNPIPIQGPADYQKKVKKGQYFVTSDGVIREKRE